MNLKELYLEIYRSRPESILRFMLVSLFVWTLLTLLFGSLRATRRGWMWFNRILAGCAVLGILGITVFYRFIGGGGEVGINLVPFRVPEVAGGGILPDAADECIPLLSAGAVAG